MYSNRVKLVKNDNLVSRVMGEFIRQMRVGFDENCFKKIWFFVLLHYCFLGE